jgi:hypothetical protein
MPDTASLRQKLGERLSVAKTWIDRFLPALFIIIGIILLVFPVILIRFGIIHDGDIPNIVKKIGEVILTSGVFAAVVKSYQFTSIFTEQLKRIIYIPSFADKVREMGIQNAWKELAAGAYRTKMPVIARAMEESLHERIPLEKTYYYQNLVSKYYVYWADDKKTHFIIKGYTEINVIMAADYEVFPYRMELKFLSEADNSWSIESLDINKIEFLKNSQPVGPKPAHEPQLKPIPQASKTKLVYEIDPPLRGENLYRVERVAKSVSSLLDDPFFIFEAANYCSSVDIKIYVMPRDIKVHFREMGLSDGFKPYTPLPPEGEGSVPPHSSFGWRYNNLLYPGQGYILMFQSV